MSPERASETSDSSFRATQLRQPKIHELSDPCELGRSEIRPTSGGDPLRTVMEPNSGQSDLAEKQTRTESGQTVHSEWADRPGKSLGIVEVIGQSLLFPPIEIVM